MKKSNIIMLFIVLIVFGVISVVSYINQEDETKKIEPKETEKTNDVIKTKAPGKENDKPLSGKQYETILKNFYEAKNFAIDESDTTFLNDFLEKDNNYTSEILNEVKGKKKMIYKVIIFKEVINIKKNVHTVKFEILNGDEKKEKIYMIKRDSNFLIVGERQ
jgi:hypothetical protein